MLFRIDPRPYEAALRQAEANALRDRGGARPGALAGHALPGAAARRTSSPRRRTRRSAPTPRPPRRPRKASQAALENARLNLEYCTIRSPLDGYVGKVLLQAGNLVKANDVNPLVVINQVRPIYVNFAVPEQTLPEVRKYMAQGPLAVEVMPPEPQQPRPRGRLIFIDNAVDPSTGTIRLRAQFDNADAALWPGPVRERQRAALRAAPTHIVVPSSAVQTGPDGQYVYVVRRGLTRRRAQDQRAAHRRRARHRGAGAGRKASAS